MIKVALTNEMLRRITAIDENRFSLKKSPFNIVAINKLTGRFYYNKCML